MRKRILLIMVLVPLVLVLGCTAKEPAYVSLLNPVTVNMTGVDWRGDLSSAPTTSLVVGTSYHNTSDGNAYIYNGVTWDIYSEPGSTGPAGPTGPTGSTGPAGPQGIQGIQGEVGPDNVTTSTSTDITGLLYGNGSTIEQGPAWDGDTLTVDNISAPTRGTVTYVIAAADAPTDWKQKANVVCTGVGDQAIVAAYSGTSIQLSPGTFTTSASTLLASNTTIRGCGPLTTYQLGVGANSSVFKLTGVSDIIISDMVIDGNSADQTTNGQLIKLETTTTRVLVQRCEIRDALLDGVSAPSTSSYLTVQDCYIHDITRYGILTSGTGYVDYNHNRIENCASIGILFGSTTGAAAHDSKAALNQISGGGSGISVVGDTTSNRAYNIIISDNIILDTNGNEIHFNKVKDSTVSSNVCKWTTGTKTGSGEGIDLYESIRCSVTGNTSNGNVHASNGTGISLDTNSNYNTVTGNTCSYNSLAGIYVYGSNYNTVTSNTCLNNSSRGIGIDSAGNSSYNILSHNECNDDGAAVQAYGIWEISNNNNVISFNTCQGNTTAQISAAGANTAVYGNKGYAPVVISSANAFDASYFTQLMSLGNFQIVPTTGWTSTLVGTGAVSSSPVYNDVHTGTTASSSALYTMGPFSLLVPASGSASASRLTWDKKMYITFNITVWGNDSQAVRRVQLKQATTIGALAALGVDIEIDNFAIKGNSYGAAGLGTVDLGTTLGSVNNYQIIIVHTPGVSDAWYINGVLKGTQTDTTLIPSGQSTADNRMAISIANGGTGGVDDYLRTSGISIWQER